MFAALLAYTGDAFLWLPSAGTAVFFASAALSLFRRAALGEYVTVTGECAGVELTAVKKRVKSIHLRTDECTLRVVLRGRMRKIPIGAEILLYAAKNTPIYEYNGSQMMHTYLAIEVRTGYKKSWEAKNV